MMMRVSTLAAAILYFGIVMVRWNHLNGLDWAGCVGLFVYIAVVSPSTLLERTIFSEEGVEYRSNLGRLYRASYSEVTVILTDHSLAMNLGDRIEVVLKEDRTTLSRLRVILQPRVARFGVD
jgi:hypothetical protein